MTSSAAHDRERHQYAVADLIDDFSVHDAAGMASLTDAQRESQVAARTALYFYVDQMWAELKRRGLEPADHPEQYNAVAAMRDLAHHLAFGVDTGAG